jgi:filamentous hemagglutinin family protein
MQRKICRQIQRRLQQKAAKALWTSVAVAGLLLGACDYSLANPAGGTVTGGTAAISGEGTTTVTITQTTDKATINWDSFSIGSGETVTFNQLSSSSIALNRVTGTDASAIYGTLSSNGKVYLINPNGILFSSTAQVNVGGIVASTLDISDSDFLCGNYTFSGSGGSVVNNGSIVAVDGGYVVLLGDTVVNTGTITAGSGTVTLGAGSRITLDFVGDGLLGLTVDRAALGALVQNSGMITADGGAVYLSAAAADTLAGTVVNNSGTIRAQSVAEVNGKIVLDGGTNGTVANSGTLDASGKDSGATGGLVKVLGETVNLADGTLINVSGDAGGGTALIGGNYQGSGAERHATITTVTADATINADALTNGDGGTVVVWSDETTTFAGTITARGGSASGDGGSVEMSGKKTLNVNGTASVNTTAAGGTTGNWLLDPDDYTIDSFNVGTLTTNLATSNITISTSAGGTGGSGDITVSTPVSWDSTYSLTLSAYRNIDVNSTITNSAGAAVTLRADNTGASTGTVSFGSGGQIATTGAVSLYYNPKTTTTTTINGTSTTVKNYAAPTDYSSYVSGGTLTAYMLVNNVTDLQAISLNLAGTYALGCDIDAGATSSWNSGAGFAPLGTSSSSYFSGIFDGGGHTISGLTITKTAAISNVGLFGYSTGTIRNVGLLDVNITGGDDVGGLVGLNRGSLTNCYTTGAVSGKGAFVGGLAGVNLGGMITNAYSTATVTSAASSSYAGGLVGYNYNGGSITTSYSTGAVNGVSSVGGLVGENGKNATITGCYSTGAVTGSGSYVGGLVGYNYDGSSITNCYSTGPVQGVSNVGGLVGRNYKNSATITGCYSTGAVTGSGSYVAGLVGYNGATITNCFWDTTISGKTRGAYGSSSGATGLTPLQWQTKGPIATGLWDTTNTWVAGYPYPVLQAFPYIIITASGTQVYGSSTPTVTGTAVTDQDGADASSLVDTTDLSWLVDTTQSAGGSYTIGGQGATVNTSGYQLTYIGVLTVEKADLTITASDASKTYCGTAALSAYSVSGLVNGDSVSSVTLTSDGTDATTNVGTYSITAGDASGTGLSNYNINYLQGELTVTPATLTITASDASKTYGKTATLSEYYVSGLKNSDSVTGVTLTSDGAAATANSGSYSVIASDAAGVGLGNYTICYKTGLLYVNPATLTVIANAASKTYGASDPTLTYGVNGLVNGDTVADVLSGRLTRDAGENAGTYAITQGTLTANSNYTITSYTGDYLTITPASLTVTADNVSRYVGQANPVFTASYSGLAGGDTAAALTGELFFTTTATPASPADSYAITLTGTLASPNYTVIYGDGVLTVRQLTDNAYTGALAMVYGTNVVTLFNEAGDFELRIIGRGISVDDNEFLKVL